MTIAFTIYGNHEDPTGNPIPKARLTRRQQWTSKAGRYALWKEYVRSACYRTVSTNGRPFIVGDNLHVREPTVDDMNAKETKPIRLQYTSAQMNIRIFWKNKAHGDPENIFGSIADALFQQDKNLDGSFESHEAKDAKGRVEVKISITDDTS